LTRGEARRFGLAVGAAFLALGAVQWWRGRPTTALLFGALGAALVLSGALLPDALVPVRRAWMGMATGISKITTPIFMGVVYFVVLTPVGVARRLMGRSPLKARPAGTSRWVPRDTRVRQPDDMQHQF
jgi:hypothetical protein